MFFNIIISIIFETAWVCVVFVKQHQIVLCCSETWFAWHRSALLNFLDIIFFEQKDLGFFIAFIHVFSGVDEWKTGCEIKNGDPLNHLCLFLKVML